MRDELGDAWAAHDACRVRMTQLEGIADRLAATSVDPQAVADYWEWKAAG